VKISVTIVGWIEATISRSDSSCVGKKIGKEKTLSEEQKE